MTSDAGKLSDIVESLLSGEADEYEIVIDAGEALRVVGGWTFLEPDTTIYLMPVRLVTLAPGLHVLRPAGVMGGALSVRVKLRREG